MEIHFKHILEGFLLVVVGAAITIPLILLNIRLAPRLGLIDWPKARGVAEDQVPIVGHSLVILALATLLVLTQLYSIGPWVFITAGLMAIMGYFDDRKPLPALDKMFFQIASVSVVVFLDDGIREAVVQKYGWMGTAWAIFFIIGLMNAVNFMDGIDGLAGLVLVVGAIGYVLLSQAARFQHPYLWLALVLVGGFLPFLFVNVKLRRGFLGNVGSYFFSYLLGIMHLSIPMDIPEPVSRLGLSALCFLVPVADAATVLVSRLIAARSPFEPDRGHLHHRMIQTSLPLRHVLCTFGLVELFALGTATLLAHHHEMRQSILPIYLCLTQVGMVALLIVMLELASKRRTQAYFQRLDAGDPIYFLKYEFKKRDGTPISAATLRRLEARVAAEIRVTDLCYAEKPATLFVTLKTLPEPLKGISARLEAIFESEKLQTSLAIDQGEFVKISRNIPTDTNRKAG